MPLSPLSPIDTRFFFRPVSSALVELLSSLEPADFDKPTVAGTWVVRDVLAHLTDITLRRLSFHRDGMVPPPPPKPIASERDFAEFINWLNAQWIDATRRCSPRVLTDMFADASADVADWYESLPVDAPALFGVSWAGEMTSEGWFDVGREFTELWHHQEQIRMAVGAPSLEDPRYLRAVIALAVRALPHAFRDVRAERGATLGLDVTGAAGGQWTLTREDEGWTLHAGLAPSPTTRVRIVDEAAWKLFFNALKGRDAEAAAQVEGRSELAQPLLKTRSIVI